LKSGGGLASKDRLFVAVLAREDTPVNDGECADLDTVAKTGKRFECLLSFDRQAA
jgi:hypothetical protein